MLEYFFDGPHYLNFAFVGPLEEGAELKAAKLLLLTNLHEYYILYSNNGLRTNGCIVNHKLLNQMSIISCGWANISLGSLVAYLCSKI
jgi:hypothetical protein